MFIVAVVVLAGVAGYFVGSFGASFDSGLCYSSVIVGIADEARSAIRVGGSSELQRFQGFMDSLPLRGYETDCGELDAAVHKNRAK